MIVKKYIMSVITICCLIGAGAFLIIYRGDVYQSSEGNKSLPRNDSYTEENFRRKSEKVYSFSIDDFIGAFEDITKHDTDYNSIFENETFQKLKKIHDQYGLKVTCYVFYESDGFALNQCSDKYKNEFIANASWLKFAFHSLNGSTIYNGTKNTLVKDYKMTTDELIRIVGLETIDPVVRLASFQGDIDSVRVLSKLESVPITGLLTADDLRNSYGLSPAEKAYLYSHDLMKKDDLIYYSTDLRIELIEDIDAKIKEVETSAAWNNQTDYLVVFTHEWALSEENVIKNISKLAEWAMEDGYEFDFLTH